MGDFSIRKQFMFLSFELTKEERQIFDRYYTFLDKSGAAEIIGKHIHNCTEVGGRPNVNYYNLFATVLYGFSCGRITLRDLEDACGHDIRYIDLMEQVRPSYSTIANFINKVIVPNEKEIFGAINKQIIKELSIDITDAFVDGTKWEANANKYKFVWKPVTYHKKLSATFFSILKENSLCEDFRKEELVRSGTVSKALSILETFAGNYSVDKYESLRKSIVNILVKVLEYEEKERICGESRNSYYKTDHDATAMCLKSDYYSGLGTNMHAAYSVQALVSNGIVLSYLVSNSRCDTADFIPVLQTFKDIYGQYPKNVCADSAYGSLDNYKFLQHNKIGNYVKHTSWEGNVSGKYPDSYRLNEDGSITCLNGKIGNVITISDRHPKKSGGIFYQVEDCDGCLYKDYCMRFMKNIDQQHSKIFEVVPEFLKLKQQAEENLLSVKGIEIRVNRSIQAEGVFAVAKQDIRYTRIRRRGSKNVSTEIMLMFLGLNLKKLFNYFKTGKTPTSWIAPKNLEPQQFKKPSAKRLSKKGRKINAKNYKIKQA